MQVGIATASVNLEAAGVSVVASVRAFDAQAMNAILIYALSVLMP